MQRRVSSWWRLVALIALVWLAAVGLVSAGTGVALADQVAVYTNPLDVQIPGGGRVESCADPSLIKGQTEGDSFWYIYCTTDPLNGQDRNAEGNLNFHFIPILKSSDLVHWTYAGDVFSARPTWVKSDAGLWAPDIEFFNGKYYLYYTASDTSLPGGGSAIGVATSASPTEGWTDSGTPVVEPQPPPGSDDPNARRWVFDPDVIEVGGQKYIYYGSYYGGISVRTLSADGLHSDPASQVQVVIPNRYEGANVVQHDGYLYLFGSATNCCNGPLTGYSVFVGRSQSPLGPFVDKEGVSLLAGRVGGTPAISMNGNRWVGPGHNFVFQDAAGQDWFLYHAVDRFDPYFAGSVGFTKRPVLMDRLDWVDGWPTVRAGAWASDGPQPAPATRADETTPEAQLTSLNWERRLPVGNLSDDFTAPNLNPRWTWVRPPDAATFGLSEGTFRFDTQDADLYVDSNNASVLTEATPEGDYAVETKVKLNLPPEGCCHNYVQAGLVIYGDDNNFIKLTHVSIWETRQTEFAKEVFPVPSGFPRYGNTVVGPPDEWTYLRIEKRRQGDEEAYTGFTSRDGQTWTRGGTWTHNLGPNARIGLVAMGGTGFTANFDYVHVFRLTPRWRTP